MELAGESLLACEQYFGDEVVVADLTIVAFSVSMFLSYDNEDDLNEFLGRLKVELDRLGTSKADLVLIRTAAKREFARIRSK